MDPTKHSNVNSSGGNESVMEESSVLWRNGVDGETDIVDGDHHRGSADKNKLNILGYQRRTKQKVVTDFATVNKGASAGAKPRAALRQVLFSQGVSEKNPAPEERGQLDLLKHELGTYAVPVNLSWVWEEGSRGTMLEKSWTEIVVSHVTMSKMQKHQQEALWEFVHTELAYINKLIIIKDLVIASLVNLHRNGFLLEVTPELLFSNLPAILSAHQLFWKDVIYPMLHEVRRTGMPFNPTRLEAGCLQAKDMHIRLIGHSFVYPAMDWRPVRFQQYFSCYLHYCWEEENSLEFTRRQMETNPHFFTFIKWVESHPQGQRMRLGDMQAKPHQRITKYPLLFKAMLKTTQDPQVQQTLRGMLSSVNSFLESINNYLKVKDEKLALSISAQRVEGYEVEGINEEIDKYVREICQFDLTCPIKGVGPGIVRKLLLEENLKIRGRKDSKLEVVALLFSDVLLMTKVQKKGERLKVVRPPLALDRTYCLALKDGCSFVLVEVGELQSVMNVYTFAASTQESCSTWVSTIHESKETLKSWRETESNRKLKKQKITRLRTKSLSKPENDDTAKDDQLLQSGRETSVDNINGEYKTPQSINGTIASKETEERPLDDASHKTVVSFFHPQHNYSEGEFVDKNTTGQQESVKGYEWIEMGVRKQVVGIHADEGEKRDEMFRAKVSGRVLWNKGVHSIHLDHFNHNVVPEPLRYKSFRPHSLLLGGYPDVDYPKNKDSNSQSTDQPTSDLSRVPVEGGISTMRDSESQSGIHYTNKNQRPSHSKDPDVPPDAWSFSKYLKSPGLRKRRPISSSQGTLTQTSRQLFQDSRPTWSASLNNSDRNQSTKKNLVPSEQRLDSQQVFSMKSNQEPSWNTHNILPSEPELPSHNSNDKWPEIKSKRSASIPIIMVERNHEPLPHSRSMYTLPHDRSPSTLEGLLERAKERTRERDGFKRHRNLTVATLKYPPPSPSFSTTPSVSPSDGDRETEEEVEVELMRYRALTVSKGWKEQLVDGDEDDKRDSVIFSDGVNVDWPVWCFDDSEVMENVHPAEESLFESTLALWDAHRLSEQEEGECCQV